MYIHISIRTPFSHTEQTHHECCSAPFVIFSLSVILQCLGIEYQDLPHWFGQLQSPVLYDIPYTIQLDTTCGTFGLVSIFCFYKYCCIEWPCTCGILCSCHCIFVEPLRALLLATPRMRYLGSGYGFQRVCPRVSTVGGDSRCMCDLWVKSCPPQGGPGSFTWLDSHPEMWRHTLWEPCLTAGLEGV